MKRFPFFQLFFSLILYPATATVVRADEKSDIKVKIENQHKTNVDTKKTVQGVLDAVAKGGKNTLIEGEIKDANMWMERGNKLLETCEKEIKASKYSQKLLDNLSSAWNYYVQAGSAAVRAKTMQDNLKSK